MPQAVSSHCQVEMDGAAYSIGGNNDGYVYKLEQGAAEWVRVSSLNTARYGHSCAVMNSHIYVMGGYLGNNSVPPVATPPHSLSKEVIFEILKSILLFYIHLFSTGLQKFQLFLFNCPLSTLCIFCVF